jgi:hypothetical protein
MSEHTTRSVQQLRDVAQFRDAYIRFGFRLCRMGGDLDDLYREMQGASDDACDAIYRRVIADYGWSAWSEAIRHAETEMP